MKIKKRPSDIGYVVFFQEYESNLSILKNKL
jgi:hypothetical protein